MQVLTYYPRAFAILFTLITVSSIGCSITTKSHSSSSSTKLINTTTQVESLPTAYTGPLSAPIPVVRYDRYTLVELMAQPAQRDLMQQIIEISVPPTLDATVGDALHYVLLRSGYRLCAHAEATTLYTLPLPAAHLYLGPLTLRDALLTLAGPAWDLSVDDAFRQVCFEPQPSIPTLEVQP